MSMNIFHKMYKLRHWWSGVVFLSISILVSYIILGFTLAAPIGPVNSARLDKGIKNGFWHAWVVGTGSMVADGFFMLLVYLGYGPIFGNTNYSNISLAIWRIYPNLFRI